MQKAFSLIVMALACMTTVSAQQLKVKQATIDVGQVVYREPVTVRFELNNADNRPVAIDHVETSCGCSTTDLQPRTVAGNEHFIVSATYDAKQMGHFEKSVSIITRGRTTPLLLTIKGVVVSEVSEFQGAYNYQLGTLLCDRNTIDFGDIVQGDNPFVDIHVKNPTEQPLSPVVMHEPSYLHAEASPTTIPPGKTGVVRMMFASQALKDYGQVQTRVYLGDHPGDKVNNSKAIDISALLLPNVSQLNTQKAPRLVLSDNKADFGDFDGKARRTMTLILENNGDNTLHIHSMEMNGEGVKVSLPKRMLKPGEHTKMKITAERRQMTHSNTQPQVLLVTNDPHHTKVIINITGR